MKIQKAARKRYGRFFYRFPNGESAADVYDRITDWLAREKTLRVILRHIGRFQPPGEQSPNMNLVIVSHGLTLRVFLDEVYKWTVHQFEALQHLAMAKIVVMERGHGGRQKHAKPGELNYDCQITGPSYFTHFDNDQQNLLHR
ncbi:UNVERIFIED_CONTAM: Phosphoglycerate mutase-like protein AT74H [Sesamum angustifolium]|uniref:Phosphoglycerate mutase-like protein AT74H n=1 Tax=Sesamum angustifolium TaxID=2727405 RepID=A0AAW2M990_9LAMI